MDTFSLFISSPSTDNSTFNDETISIKQEYDHDPASVSYNIIPTDQSMTDSDNEKNSIDEKRSIEKRYTTVTYGPIVVRVNLHESPTLKTGRRSRFIPLEGEEARKREVRREKNRHMARKLKEKRLSIERQLLEEIIELESNEKDLTEEVRNLESYKQFLQKRYQQKLIATTEMFRKTSFKIEYEQ